jgi:hypothetical protein
MYLTALQQGCYKIPLAQLAPGDVELSPSDFKNTFFFGKICDCSVNWYGI